MSHKPSPIQPQQSEEALSEPFTIQLTSKQAEFLAKLLPQRYSLQPEIKKKGPKSKKKSYKDGKHSNLPPRVSKTTKTTMRPPPQQPKKCNQTPPKRDLSPCQPEKMGQANEETRVPHEMPPSDKKSELSSSCQWRLHFLKEARMHILFEKAYGKVFDLLQERTRARTFSQEDFHQTMLKVIGDEKMRRTKKGEDLSEQLKSLYFKYRRNNLRPLLNSEKKGQETPKVQSPLPSPMKSPPNKKQQKTPIKQKSSNVSFSRQKRTGSESSDDLGVDFDLNEVPAVKPTMMIGDSHSMEATFISQNLRKIPSDDVLFVLNKYGLTNIDVLNIKALPAPALTQLFTEIRTIKSNLPKSISDSEQSHPQQAESSFQIQQD